MRAYPVRATQTYNKGTRSARMLKTRAVAAPNAPRRRYRHRAQHIVTDAVDDRHVGLESLPDETLETQHHFGGVQRAMRFRERRISRKIGDHQRHVELPRFAHCGSLYVFTGSSFRRRDDAIEGRLGAGAGKRTVARSRRHRSPAPDRRGGWCL